jgi:hypothetical protein
MKKCHNIRSLSEISNTVHPKYEKASMLTHSVNANGKYVKKNKPGHKYHCKALGN